jgi:hypothetical protein
MSSLIQKEPLHDLHKRQRHGCGFESPSYTACGLLGYFSFNTATENTSTRHSTYRLKSSSRAIATTPCYVANPFTNKSQNTEADISAAFAFTALIPRKIHYSLPCQERTSRRLTLFGGHSDGSWFHSGHGLGTGTNFRILSTKLRVPARPRRLRFVEGILILFPVAISTYDYEYCGVPQPTFFGTHPLHALILRAVRGRRARYFLSFTYLLRHPSSFHRHIL